MLITLIFTVAIWVVDSATTCPEKYARFSPQHSFCTERNPTCSIITEGVDKEARKTILKVHNKLRSKIATGKEKRAGGLPTASNMLQMEWDLELASIAQKWAEQCRFDHDCDGCRAVENFYVGQNVALGNWPNCPSNDCSHVKPDWKTTIKNFYSEVPLFNKKDIGSFPNSTEFGHFTQVAWAKTWRIGCGYVTYKYGNGAQSIYVCNYGPGGNLINTSMYEPGTQCSSCPSNTCCGCKIKGPTYNGLCKVRNLSLGPVYEQRKDALLDCNWKDEKSACAVKTEGKDWKLKRSLGGFYKTITLKSGEKSVLRLVTLVQPKSNIFCVAVVYRKGPTNAAVKDSSSLSLLFKVPEMNYSNAKALAKTTSRFRKFNMSLEWNAKTELALEVNVPANSPEHIIDVKEIIVSDGSC